MPETNTPPLSTTPIEKPTVILVEGKEDELVIRHLATRLKIDKEIDIRPIAGKTQLSQNLAALKITSVFANVQSLGIIRDADSDAKAAFDSVCAALRANSLPVPTSPEVKSVGSPSVNILILPGDGKPGMLEDICLQAVVDTPAFQCVDDYFNCLSSQNITVPDISLSKAKALVYIASQLDPDIRLGIAVAKGYFDVSHSSFDNLRNFLIETSIISNI